MTAENEEGSPWVRIKDSAQLWWEITCTYDGTSGRRALSSGNSQEEAELNFFGSMAEPEKAVITAIAPMAKCTLDDLFHGNLPEDC